MLVGNMQCGLFSVEQHHKLFLNEAQRLCPVPARHGGDTHRAVLQTASTHAEEQATARIIGICSCSPQFSVFLNTSTTTVLLRLFLFSFFETPPTSTVWHLTSIHCLGTVASTPPPADRVLAHIITSFFKRARGRFVKQARAHNSCVHTTQINWTLGSSVLGFGPGLPSVQTC